MAEELTIVGLMGSLCAIYESKGDLPIEIRVDIEGLFNPDGESPQYVDLSDVEYQEEGEGFKAMATINTMEKDQ